MLGSGDILTLSNGSSACVGFVASNKFGDLFAVTSRDFLNQGGNSVSAKFANRTTSVGVIGDRWFSESEVWQGARAYSWFPINKNELVRSENLADCSLLNPDLALNTAVHFVGQNGVRHSGRIQRSASSLHVNAITRPYRIDNRLLEVTADNDSRFGDIGDAGSLVHTETNELAGIILGFRKGRTLVAPLYDFIEAERFGMATLAQINAHNSSVKERTIEERIEQRIKSSPRKWWNEVRDLAGASNQEFSHLRQAIGQSAMERCQDNITQSIFHLVGPQKFVEGIFNLHFENDAPGRKPNENWVWRSTFERLRLLRITDNGRCFVAQGSKDEICPVALYEDAPVVAPTVQYEEHGPLTREIFEELSAREKASLLFGENEIETRRVVGWMEKS